VLLSPQHALFLRGVLIPVGLLVNGHSIARLRVDRITYYHIELPAHAILLAEGVEAESYLNTDERGTFDPLMPMAPGWPDQAALLWEAVGCARLVLSGAELEAVRLSLAHVTSSGISRSVTPACRHVKHTSTSMKRVGWKWRR
jgi:hypothetical protein